MHIYEINTWVWLQQLSSKYRRPITLANVPEDDVRVLANLSMDAIWMMGVWERSPHSVAVARTHPGLQGEYYKALPNFKPEDVVGSPYAVRRYVVDKRLGGKAGLATFRKQLQSYGLKLILDFVPNHVAIDHPWTEQKPNCLVQGTDFEAERAPDSFFKVDDQVYAFGRDPYFPAWTDTAQVNAFSDCYRQTATATLLDIASQCDGVRCDMAMLVLNRIFAQTWSEARVGTPPTVDFWEVIIPAVRAKHPEFIFMAEVYWDMEYELQQQGFDYCYDKQLYDRLVNGHASSVGIHLIADLSYQRRLVRFIENHDEPRAMTALGMESSKVGAVLVATLPGAKLWHEGQFIGHRIKLPVQLGRRPNEADVPGLSVFYRTIIAESKQVVYCHGSWSLREIVKAWPENGSNRNLFAYTWQHDDERRLIVVNYSHERSQGRVPIPDFGLEGIIWTLTDVMDGSVYERMGDRMVQDGLYIDLQPWSAHIFSFSAPPQPSTFR